jgi:hypothetical protein
VHIVDPIAEIQTGTLPTSHGRYALRAPGRVLSGSAPQAAQFVAANRTTFLYDNFLRSHDRLRRSGHCVTLAQT